MKFRSYGELGLGAKAQVRPRSWEEISLKAGLRPARPPRVYLVFSRVWFTVSNLVQRFSKKIENHR